MRRGGILAGRRRDAGLRPSGTFRRRPKSIDHRLRHPVRQRQAGELGAPVGRQPQSHRLAPEQAVDRVPGFGCPEDQGLRRAEPAARGDPGVDPAGISLQRSTRAGRQRGIVLHRPPAQAERAHGAVEAERRPAGDLRQPPRGGPAHQLHLEHPIARVHETQRRGSVDCRAGADARNAVSVETDVHRAGQAGNAHLLGARRQGKPKDTGGNDSHEQHDDAERRQQAAQQPKE